MLTDVCLPVQILVGTSWRHLWSPWCNWSVYCDCVLSLMNVQWNSSCRHYWGTYLVYVNNVFLKKKIWLNVSFVGPPIWTQSHTRTERCFKKVDGPFPPVRWQIMFSGLRLVMSPTLSVLFVMLSLFHISWEFPLWSFSSHSQLTDSVAILMSDAWWE